MFSLFGSREPKPIEDAKGLYNKPGENNCFLNSAIQVLWQLDAFRNSFRGLEGHYCLQDACIFCALKIVFTQYEYNELFCLPPNVLRRALADNFNDEKRFCLGEMDDAAEAFESILKRIHFHLVSDENASNWCFYEYCVTHSIFGMNIQENSVCENCQAVKIVEQFSQLVYYVNAATLILETSADVYVHKQRTFGKLLNSANRSNDRLTCPSGSCGKRAKIMRNLKNCANVVTIGITWESNSMNEKTISNFFHSVKEQFEIQDLFDSLDNMNLAYAKNDYCLRALICYYGRHYIAFCFSRRHNEWLYLNDTIVEKIGPLWEMVVHKCIISRYQPYLLFYAAENPTKLNEKHAPTCTTLINRKKLAIDFK